MSERQTPDTNAPDINAPNASTPDTDPLDAIPLVPAARMLLVIAQGIEDDARAKDAPPVAAPPVAAPSLALSAQRLSAGLGDTEAMMRMGVATQRAGDGPGALSWYRMAADAGNGEGMFCVGRAFLFGEAGVTRDVRAAMAWYERAGDAGFAEGYWGVAQIHDSGHLGERDRDTAISWYTRAAEAGDVKSMRAVGQYWRDSIFGSWDTVDDIPDSARQEAARARAMLWLGRAAAHDDLPALNTLAEAYEHAQAPELVAHDFAMALRLRQRQFALGQRGEVTASLAVLYELGYGCTPEPSIAAVLYVLALEEARTGAQHDFSPDDPALAPLRDRAYFAAHRAELCTLMGKGEDDPVNFLLRGVGRLSVDHDVARAYLETRFFNPA